MKMFLKNETFLYNATFLRGMTNICGPRTKNCDIISKDLNHIPRNIYLLKFSRVNTKEKLWNMLKLRIKTPEQRQIWQTVCYKRSSCVFIVNFEHDSQLLLVFSMLIFYWIKDNLSKIFCVTTPHAAGNRLQLLTVLADFRILGRV